MDKLSISKRLETLRVEKLKLSQVQFSEKIGIKQTNYTKIENGINNLMPKHLYNIGIHFGGAAVLFVLFGSET